METLSSVIKEPMVGLDELARSIVDGEHLFIAGDEGLLRKLPKGNWIGGTMPYFVAHEGGFLTREKAYVWRPPRFATVAGINVYDAASLAAVYTDAPDNGFSLIIIPAASETLRSFALRAPRYANFATRPLIGWVSGVNLPDLGKSRPRVFDGRTVTARDDAAVVLHVRLPRDKTAEVGIVNIFEPGDGDVLTFLVDSFSAREVLVNGRPVPFVDYVRENKLDLRLPLVADYNGAMINISFQGIDNASQEVRFYAPVFRGVRYRHAKPIGDYVEVFASHARALGGDVSFSCNCILNYVYGRLEGRRAEGIVGPATFGEIAYQLLNQTLVYLRIADANLSERLRGETALRKQLRALEAMTEELEAFNSMVSHDLRAPLRHVVGLSDHLERALAEGDAASAKRYSAGMRAAALKMAALLDALMAFSRADRTELSHEAVDLGVLVEQVRRELSADIGHRVIAWEVNPLPVVHGDEGQLRQVVTNLLSNALKFTGERPEADIEIGEVSRALERGIFVRDNGTGFENRQAERLFKPFHRLGGASRFPGSGIGLATAARIIARHGGHIWAEGRPGEGACFYFTLPPR